MSSEMRESKFTNEDLETISRTWNSNKYTEHTAMLLASELLRARALLARTEAGADACAATGEGCSMRPCGPRGEVQCQYCGEAAPVADGAVAYRVRRGNGSWGIPHEYLPGSPATIAALCDEGCEVQYLHPHDASAVNDAMIDRAVANARKVVRCEADLVGGQVSQDRLRKVIAAALVGALQQKNEGVVA